MSNNLLTLPTYNIYAVPQDSDNGSNFTLVGEFTFDLDFLREYYFCDDNFHNDVPVVGLFTDMDTVNEGEQLALNFELSQPVPVGGLTVELDLIEGSDSFAEGFEFLPEASSNITNLEFITEGGEITGAEVTLAEGATDASIVSQILEDDIVEGDEFVSIGLLDGDTYDVSNSEVSFTVIDTSMDLNSVVEVEDVAIPFLGDVDFSVSIDYDADINASHFATEAEIIHSIDNYLDNELQSLDPSELMVDDLAEFLSSDSGLGIAGISESLTLDIEIAPNSLIPEPIVISSTVFA